MQDRLGGFCPSQQKSVGGGILSGGGGGDFVRIPVFSPSGSYCNEVELYQLLINASNFTLIICFLETEGGQLGVLASVHEPDTTGTSDR